MATYPPPYPPPAGTPFGFDPRQQARFAKQQRKVQERAQKAAFEAQRHAYRQQARAMRRSSILGPVLVIAIGVMFLLVRTGRISYQHFASWYLHWWPMLLVAAGVVLALEWAFDQMPRSNGAPYVRRGIGGAGVVLFLTLALTGAWAAGYPDAYDFITHGGLSINPDNVDELFGEKHQMTQPLDLDFPPGTMLAIDVPHGNVTIAGTSVDGKLHMILNKEVWTRSDDSVDSKAGELNPQTALTGSTLNVTLPSVRGATADVSISMPETGAVTINANHGSVNVSAMKAPVTVTANHGDVELDTISGTVNARINHNDASFTAHGVTGDVSVRGHAQDLTVTEVVGQVSLDGEFFGETHLQHLQGPVSFRTSRTQFSLMKLEGAVDISPDSELTGDQIVGPTILHTASRNIAFERVAGNIDVSNSKGSVDLTSSAPLGNVTVENRDGAVNLTLPDHAGVAIDAETRGGEVENDFGLSSTNQNERTSLRGAVGNGAAHVMIRTNHFDIEIHKGDVQPPAPPPMPPAAPPPPAAPVPTAKRKASGKLTKPAIETQAIVPPEVK